MSFTEQWVITLTYHSKSSYGYAGGEAYFSSQPTIKELWHSNGGSRPDMFMGGKLPANRWLSCGLLNHSDYSGNTWLNSLQGQKRKDLWDNEFVSKLSRGMAFKVRETKRVTYKQAMEMKANGILRFVIKDESNPPAAAAAAETYSVDTLGGE